MHLVEAKKQEDVLFIFKDAEIFDRISEDGHTVDNFDIPFDGKHLYMMIMLDDLAVGVWCLYPANKSTMNIHCNILQDYRKHGMAASKLIIEWFLESCPKQYCKLNAEIPVIYKDVYHFSLNNGLIKEGINRKSILKNGELVDTYMLGITKQEAINLQLERVA